MENLYFEEKYHQYFWKGEKVPCVSDVLKILDSIQLQFIPPQYLENASIRGKQIHEETENYDFGLLDLFDDEWLQENQDILNYIYAYINFKNKHPGIPMFSEEQVYSENIGFAGTIDLIKKINGKIALIDKKTTSTIKYLRNAIQLNIYRLIWNDTHKEKIEKLYILYLKDNGEYELLPYEINEELAYKYINLYKEIIGDN